MIKSGLIYCKLKRVTCFSVLEFRLFGVRIITYSGSVGLELGTELPVHVYGAPQGASLFSSSFSVALDPRIKQVFCVLGFFGLVCLESLIASKAC